MTRIKHMTEWMKDELCSAKEYAEEYLNFKVKGNTAWANKFKSMAQDELNHASNIHELLVQDIEEMSKVFTPPTEMLEKWETAHKHYVEEAAWIKQMMTL